MIKLQFLLFTCVLVHTAFAENDTPHVLSQSKMGRNACGPCSFVNSLVQSDDKNSLALLKGSTALAKAQDFAKRFGGMQSVAYGKHRTAYSDENGTADMDLLAMINQLRAKSSSPKLMGDHLLKREGESSKKFVLRVRKMIEGSLASGFPPLLSVRSVMAAESDEGRYQWNAISGHWVCVVAVEQNEEGVLILKLADSLAGKVISALMFTPNPRNCVVPLTFTVDENGKEKWDWVNGDRCVFLSSPSLPLGTSKANWHERTYIAARYIITHQTVEQDGADQPATRRESMPQGDSKPEPESEARPQ